MIKKYFQYLLLILWFSTFSISHSQTLEVKVLTNNTIDGLTLYPNPVTNGKLYISTMKNQIKKVEVYDVLGKQVINQTITNNRLNVSNLTSGIYIMKISQDNATTTKKLVIR